MTTQQELDTAQALLIAWSHNTKDLDAAAKLRVFHWFLNLVHLEMIGG